MSEFIAIAAVRGTVIHLVDWDRPCWFRADNPKGDRLIPDLDSMLTDALLFFAFADFDMTFDLFAGERGKNRVFEMKDAIGPMGIDESRKVLRGKTNLLPFILLAHFGGLDNNLKTDIDSFQTPILTAPIDISKARRFKIG